MTNKCIYPIVVAYGFHTDNCFSFMLPGREIKIEGVNEIIPAVLQCCDGFKTIEEIASIVSSCNNYDRKGVKRLINVLLERQILVDVHGYYQLFHGISANPSLFSRPVSKEEIAEMIKTEGSLSEPVRDPQSPLEKLLEIRESCREFSKKPLSRKEILSLGWVIYGKIKRSISYPESEIGLGTVPSGGALYPLKIFLIVVREDTSLQKGVFYLGPKGIIGVGNIGAKTLQKIFGGYTTPLDSAADIFVLVCDFNQIIQKYSNRGYRYALLEAGHAAQNAYLWCAEQGLGVIEVCGFNDEELAKAIRIPYPKQAPLTTIFVGRRS